MSGYGYNTGYRYGGSSSGYARSSGAGGGGGVPPIALVTSVSAEAILASTTTVTTAAVNTTGANLIILAASYYVLAGGGPSVSDSAGNVWTALTAYGTGDRTMKLYYSINPVTSASHTFTFTSTNATYPSLAMMAFSGAAGGYGLAENGAGAVATSIATGSVTPSINNCLLVTGLSFTDSTVNATINSAFTVAQSLPSANKASVAAAYKVQTTAGAENPTWTQGGAASAMATSIAVFKPTV